MDSNNSILEANDADSILALDGSTEEVANKMFQNLMALRTDNTQVVPAYVEALNTHLVWYYGLSLTFDIRLFSTAGRGFVVLFFSFTHTL